MPETTNGEWLKSLPDNELTKYLNTSAICIEIVKDRKACPNCSCGECIRMWLGRKRGKE